MTRNALFKSNILHKTSDWDGKSQDNLRLGWDVKEGCMAGVRNGKVGKGETNQGSSQDARSTQTNEGKRSLLSCNAIVAG